MRHEAHRLCRTSSTVRARSGRYQPPPEHLVLLTRPYDYSWGTSSAPPVERTAYGLERPLLVETGAGTLLAVPVASISVAGKTVELDPDELAGTLLGLGLLRLRQSSRSSHWVAALELVRPGVI